MKRLMVCLLLFSVLLGACACGQWVSDSYYAVESHIEQLLPTQTEPPVEEPVVVANRNELRGAVLSFIRNWIEHGYIEVSAYVGNVSEDLTEILTYASEEDPIGAYAVDFADAEFFGTAQQGHIEVSIVFRRSAAEIDSIVTVSSIHSATERILQALKSYDSALTLRIRNYIDTDFVAFIHSYCLENPDEMLLIPALSADIYPQEGETRILELHFDYPESRDRMREMLQSLNTILSSTASYVRSGANDSERAALLYRFLTTRFDYVIGGDTPNMPAYSLLCEGIAHSLSFAAVFRAESTSAGLECLLVSGTRGGETHYWNMLRLNGDYYHLDLMRAVELGEPELTFLTPEQLAEEAYDWDRSAYPETPEPDEPDTPDNPNNPTVPTDNPVPPTEPPTETSEPTEPSTQPTTVSEPDPTDETAAP